MANITDVKLPDSSQYDLKDNVSGYQTETLATPITVDGTSETTVEGALGAVNDYANKIKGSMSNENLVDNPFFTVNERGFSSQSITSKTYTVSRWYGQSDSAATFSISGSGYSIASGSNDAFIMQLLNNYSRLNGKTVTASVKLSDGTIKSGTVTLNTGTSVDILTETTFKVRYASGSHGLSIVSFAGNTTVIKAVKLELGSISTLANDVAPDYALELAKCQTSTADPSDTYANQGQLMTSALQGVYGSKNLNKYPYYNTTKTQNGITFTDNGDGTVTVSGTASDTASFYCHALPAYDNNPLSLKAGKYLITGCPNGGSDNTYYMWFTHNTEYHDTGSGLEVNLPNDTSNISYGIMIAAGTAITTPITFKPMIRDARVTDDTYEPFAMTNQQLTTDIKPVTTYKYGTVRNLSATIKGEIETSFTNAANYSLFSGSTSGDTEGGWYGFKHTSSKYCHMIFFDRSGIYAITRAADGTYTKNVIFENN